MPLVDEAKRHDLYVAIEGLIGPERAETLMSMMPPTTADELVTKEYLTREFKNFEHRFEAKLHKELRDLTRTLLLGMVTTMAATTSLCIGAIALAQ
jgi:hypothetical protein